jgi:protein ImuA
MPVKPSETLHALRRAVADLTAGVPGEDNRQVSFGVVSLDQALAGGLVCGALHEISPAAPLQGGAATGFAVALAARALRERGQAVWIQPDFTVTEAGALYGLGFDLMGLLMERVIILRVPHPRDVLWAMEEALKCHAVAVAVAEFAREAADLTATRRLALAARAGGGLGLILHLNAACDDKPLCGQPFCRHPTTATTRWEVASAFGMRDRFGGLGPTAFALSLVKNRHGRTGQWRLSWDHHECTFAASLSLPVASATRDGSHRSALPRDESPLARFRMRAG